MKRGKRPNIQIKEKINKMVQAGMTFPEIAEILKFRSRQAVRWHFLEYRKMMKGEGFDK